MEFEITYPTEQYGNIKIRLTGEIDGAIDIYKEMHQKWLNRRSGLEPKDWRAALDRYLTDGTMDSEMYAEMNDWQKSVVQEIKRSFKRFNRQ